MKKMVQKISGNKKVSIFILVVVLGIFYYFLSGGRTALQSYEVKFSSIEQSVELSGTVKTSDRADLGFASSGRVSSVYVKNGEQVKAGALLAGLEVGDLLADLKIKELNSQATSVDLESAKEELERVTTKEDIKVESAYRALLSSDLLLENNSSNENTDLTPPTVSGIYDGIEGQYKVIIKKDDSNSSDYTLRTFLLEETNIKINREGSTALGTHGLYVTFPSSDLSEYDNTVWYVNIPNKAGSSYLANYNNYKEVKSSRDLAVKNASYDYQKLLTENNDGNSVASAEVQKIRAEIRKNMIYAPFDGIVTNIEKEVGENASIGERVITVLGENKLEVVLKVSELDVSKLIPGAEVKIKVDALPGEVFTGTLKTVNLRDTEIDGVPVYEAFVELPSDSRIKTGMNAYGTVVLVHKYDVLTVPIYSITKEGNDNFVTIQKEDGSTEKRQVNLGILGSDSMVEVISGLSAGEKILSQTTD